jgi:hypothetical protein
MGNTDKLNKLYGLLDNAKRLSSEFSGGYSNHFLSAEEFHLALSESISKLKSGDTSEIDRQYFWFALTCDWDDLIGKDGQTLANEIFELLSDIRKTIILNGNK